MPAITYSTNPADFYYVGVNIPCQNACPASTNVPAYIRSAYEKLYDNSYEINRMVNVLPGVLGRICSRPCENKCRHGESELGAPVQICYLKRSAADFKAPGHLYREQFFAPLGKKVCIIGSGPAGLAAAHDLTTVGFNVTILEAFEKPGGMLQYGIPEFRLPRDVLKAEIDAILRMGITLKTGVRVGDHVQLDGLTKEYDAVLVAAGCYVSRNLDVPGEGLNGVHTGLEFVVDANEGKPPAVGSTVLVLGAGFTAFDCARSALRLGAKNVSICIRGLEEDLRVTADEIHEAKSEGVKIKSLMVSTRILGNGKVEGVEFTRTRPGERQSNGRRRIEPIQGSEFTVPADSVIVAVGQGAKPIKTSAKTDSRGVVQADQANFITSLPNLYVSGDFLTGPTTVIESIASGRRAAERIARNLTGKSFREWTVRIQDHPTTDRERAWDFIPPVEMPKTDPDNDRFDPVNREVELGYSDAHTEEESKRCYLCYQHYEIDVSKCIYCRYCIDVAPRDCIKLVQEMELNEWGAITKLVETNDWRKVNAVYIDNERCIRCGACAKICPVDCISVSKVELVERMITSGGVHV
jgi:glutamate synthase (NADPH) small chain